MILELYRTEVNTSLPVFPNQLSGLPKTRSHAPSHIVFLSFSTTTDLRPRAVASRIWSTIDFNRDAKARI
jgi:hypothetical protein